MIELIEKSVQEFAPPLNKSIKVIGLEEDQSTPRLILFDLVIKRPYLREINIFKIRINPSNYEVLTNKDSFVVDKLESITDIINKAISNYDIQELTNQNEKKDLLESVDQSIQKNRKRMPSLPKAIEESFQWSRQRPRYIGATIEATAQWGAKRPKIPKAPGAGYNKRRMLRKINQMMAKQKVKFRATNVKVQKDYILASDNHGTIVKFLIDNKQGQLSLEGPIDKPSRVQLVIPNSGLNDNFD